MNIINNLFRKKYKYEITIANGKTIGTQKIEYGDVGIKYNISDGNSYRFIPYAAILWVDYNEDYTK